MLNSFRWIAVAALISGPAVAGPTSQWVSVAENSAMDVGSVRPAGADVLVSVLRDYRETLTLGTYMPSSTPMYPHRSALIDYTVSCSSRKLDVQGWRLFSGRDAEGEVVWADRNFERAAPGAAESVEEQGVIDIACGKSIARR